MSSRAARLGIAVTGSGLLARRWYVRWGATDEEVGAALPGDGLVTDADLTATRAVTIGRPAALVEPEEAVSAVMSQRMLRGIRDRAERTPTSGPTASMDHRHKETT